MTDTLAAALNRQHADADVVHQAVRYYLAERFGDLDVDQMRQTVAERVGSTQADAMVFQLIGNPGLLEQSALLILSSAWSDEQERERLASAVGDAKGKLALVEAGLLALVTIYGLYLLATGGVRRSDTTVIRRPDGSYEERTVVEYTDPGSALGSLLSRIRGKSQTSTLDTASPPSE